MKKYANVAKARQKNLRLAIKSLILGEFALVGVIGYFWQKLYYNQDYRQKWSRDHPMLLETYYKFMSGYQGGTQKELDRKAWEQSSS